MIAVSGVVGHRCAFFLLITTALCFTVVMDYHLSRHPQCARLEPVSMLKGEDLTALEAANLLGKSRPTIIRWCSDGYLRGAHKTPGPGRTQPWRIPRIEIERLMRGTP